MLLRQQQRDLIIRKLTCIKSNFVLLLRIYKSESVDDLRLSQIYRFGVFLKGFMDNVNENRLKLVRTPLNNLLRGF